MLTWWRISFSRKESYGSNRARLARSRKTSCRPPTTPQTIQELERAFLEEWYRIPQLVINSLINSMPQRCSTLLAVRGNHTPY
ncbi:transposable element Tcb2 transposase [Trichonephila clavipes]|nr:transposable element Tcb2 transposase [Trichonephila clavipes]